MYIEPNEEKNELFAKLDLAEIELESRFPTPQSVLDAINNENKIIDRKMELLEIEYRTAEEEAELNAATDYDENAINNCAIADNHLLTLVRRHIFVADLDETNLNLLTKVPDFYNQLHAHESLLFDHCLIDTLIKNGIDTAKKYEDCIDVYFETLDLTNDQNYTPIHDDLKKFIGIEINSELRLEYEDNLLDEHNTPYLDEITFQPIVFNRDVLIFESGIVTEKCVRRLQNEFGSETHTLIIAALQAQIDRAITDENYEIIRPLQTQLDKLK